MTEIPESPKPEASSKGQALKNPAAAARRRRGYQTSDFADGLPAALPNPQGGGNDGLDDVPGCGGFEGTDGYLSGPNAADIRDTSARRPKRPPIAQRE